MSYTDIETGNRGYRVIYTDHKINTDARQLPKSAVALLREGMAAESCDLFDLLEQGGDYIEQQEEGTLMKPAKDTISLRKAAREKGLPIVAIEPLYNLDSLKSSASEIVLPSHTQIAGPQFFAGWLFSEGVVGLRLRGNLTEKGMAFQAINAYNRRDLRENPLAGLRDLLMAENALSFAQIFETKIKLPDKPWYAIIVGLQHTGLVGALRMNPDDRIHRILSDRNLEYFQQGKLGESVYTVYKGWPDRWEHHTFHNPRL